MAKEIKVGGYVCIPKGELSSLKAKASKAISGIRKKKTPKRKPQKR